MDRYIEESEIIASRTPMPSCGDCGVYFLIFDGVIVYVGQSKSDVGGRILKHRFDGKKFDSYTFIAVDIGIIDLVESFYIHTMRPKLNSNYTGSSKKFAPVTIGKMFNILVIDMEKNNDK